MLYQRYMIYRVRSNCKLSYTHRKTNHTRLSLIALPFLTLCASGLYASLGIFDGDTPQLATQIPAPFIRPITPIEQAGLTPPLPQMLEPMAAHPARDGDNLAPPAATATSSEGTAPTMLNELELLAIAEEMGMRDDDPVERNYDIGTEPPIEAVIDRLLTEEKIFLQPTDTTPAEEITEQTDTVAEAEPEDPSIGGRWVEAEVASGDSLSKIFQRLGLSQRLLDDIMGSTDDAKQLANIQPGQTIRVRLDDDDTLQELILKRNVLTSLHITPEKASYVARVIDKPTTKRTSEVSGTITSSLYANAQQAGLSDSTIMELAQIFGWDIDFALELRVGDRFSVIFEEELVDGEKIRNGPILAAEFVNRGNIYRAIRFEDESGHSDYYTAEGNSMRKAFLRAPVDFRRISSHFQPERYHPVLGKKRPHRGVDYAASTGTPIRAAGDGRVIFRGGKNGYGNTVILQHGEQYTTLYAHLSKFNAKVQDGTRVKQGQIIGYVGSTGLATGPHLHYEFRVNGEHKNPITVQLPTSMPIEKAYRGRFKKIATPLIAQLDSISRTMVAEASIGQSKIR